MMTLGRKAGFVAATSCALAVSASLFVNPARADDGVDRMPLGGQVGAASQDEARKRFGRGLELYREADYPAALSEFRRAYVLMPNYRLLFNIGQVCFQLQNYACALQSFEQYLMEGGTEVPAARRTAVENDMEKLRTRVAKLTIRTNVRGATIAVDDVPIGTAPLDSVMVSAGTRRIIATADGRPPVVRSITVAGEEATTIDLDFGESGRSKGETSTSPTAPKRESGPIPSWPFWLSTAGLAAAAGVMGFLATNSNDELGQLRNTYGTSRQQLESTERRASTYALATDVLTGAAIVSGGIALYTTLTAKKRTENGTTPLPRTSTGGLDVAVGFLAVDVRGTF